VDDSVEMTVKPFPCADIGICRLHLNNFKTRDGINKLDSRYPSPLRQPCNPNYYFVYAGSDPAVPESFTRMAEVSGTQWQGSIVCDRRFYFVVSYSGASTFP